MVFEELLANWRPILEYSWQWRYVSRLWIVDMIIIIQLHFQNANCLNLKKFRDRGRSSNWIGLSHWRQNISRLWTRNWRFFLKCHLVFLNMIITFSYIWVPKDMVSSYIVSSIKTLYIFHGKISYEWQLRPIFQQNIRKL